MRERRIDCADPRLLAVHGFSLIELLVAIAVFLMVSAATFTLFNRQQTLLARQEGLAGLNIGLRNALTQIQMDAVNAGDGLVIGPWATTSWPLGVTIYNQIPAAPCNIPSTYQYGATCFDTLNVYMADPNACSPAVQVCNPTTALNTNSASTVIIAPAAGSISASSFQAGDTLLLVKSNGSAFTTVALTANGTASGASNVQLSFTSTSSAVNPKDALPPAGDGLLITTSTQIANPGNLTNSFTTTDLVIHLVPITYSVSVSNPNDPQLMRQVAAGTPSVVMDQVVSFKVGAALVADGTDNYYYNATAALTSPPMLYMNGGYNDDFTRVRSVRVNLMARTSPNGTLGQGYNNLFDGGPYQVLGASVVVNPRNLSMNDQ